MPGCATRDIELEVELDRELDRELEVGLDRELGLDVELSLDVNLEGSILCSLGRLSWPLISPGFLCERRNQGP